MLVRLTDITGLVKQHIRAPGLMVKFVVLNHSFVCFIAFVKEENLCPPPSVCCGQRQFRSLQPMFNLLLSPPGRPPRTQSPQQCASESFGRSARPSSFTFCHCSLC